MNENIYRRRTFRRLWSSWSTFFFMFFFFYIIGDLIADWWDNPTWMWIILAFSLFFAVMSTIRVLIFRSSRISPDAGTRHYTSSSNNPNYIPESDPQHLPAQPEDLGAKQSKTFCKFCGNSIEKSAPYCANCGAMVEE